VPQVDYCYRQKGGCVSYGTSGAWIYFSDWSNKYVTFFTAAHCVTTRNGERMNPKYFSVYLGRYDLRNHREQNTQQIDVCWFFTAAKFTVT
jgi:hypothetical protein